MIDWQQVATLRDEVGEDEFPDVASMFLDEVEQALADLRDDPDPTQTEARLHGLKGASLTLGFAGFSALCRDGEIRARQGETIALDPLFESYAVSRAAFAAATG